MSTSIHNNLKLTARLPWPGIRVGASPKLDHPDVWAPPHHGLAYTLPRVLYADAVATANTTATLLLILTGAAGAPFTIDIEPMWRTPSPLA